MNGVVFDTDILIELLRGKDAQLNTFFEGLLAEAIPLYYTAVSSAEIAHGARATEAAAIAQLLAFFTCLPIDCETALDAGHILQQFRRSHSTGLGDSLIAAAAINRDLPLWTRNRKHYPDPRLRFFERPSIGGDR